MSAAELAAFVDGASRALIATDFDGTLSPIVDDPAAAAPIDGAAEVLGRLSTRVAEVAVISGRPLSYLSSHFPEGLTLVGLYGLDVRRDGERQEHPEADRWRGTVAEVAAAARADGPEFMLVELKDLSITLHYREHAEIATEVAQYANEVAGPAGLHVRPARMSVELHPPIDEDKGTALTRLARDHDGPVMFIGDDVGDVPAFRALDAIAAAGRPVQRVAVESPELPDQLRQLADRVVDGPAGVVQLLGSLVT